MKYINAAFELLVALACGAFFLYNVPMLFAAGTHPQWRFGIVVSAVAGLAAAGFFWKSLQRIRGS
jgi:hypothetical protein